MTTLAIKTTFDADKIADRLNTLLASTIHFYFVYKNYHWNLIDPNFYSLHLLFDKHAEEIYATVDPIAERIRKIGKIVEGRMETFSENTKLTLPMQKGDDAPAIMHDLKNRHDVYIAELREIIELANNQKDYATADELTGYLEIQGTQRWFIASHNELAPTK